MDYHCMGTIFNGNTVFYVVYGENGVFLPMYVH